MNLSIGPVIITILSYWFELGHIIVFCM